MSTGEFIQRGTSEDRVSKTTGALRERLVKTLTELVQIPSENTPPTGSELGCQQYVHERLSGLGLKSEMYDIRDVPGLTEHTAFRHERDYAGRPNVAALWQGSGGGRSLLLSGHIDTVPRGSARWSRDPFGAAIEGNRLYGLGSNDMKGGIAAMLVAVEALKEAGVKLRGDLLVETIVDEEFGGVNGTLAGRLRGHNADAAIITEPSQQMICPAQTGGRTAHITLHAENAGILGAGPPPPAVADQIQYLLGQIKSFARQRKEKAPVHNLYAGGYDPVPVWVTKIHSGGWGMNEPITLPTICRIELYWQSMPGEELEAIDREFFAWFEQSIAARADLFTIKPEINFPIEFLPGSAIDPRQAVVTELSETFQQVTGAEPLVRGIGGPCDMFVFHRHFGSPALLFGPRGGNTHNPDEWVDLDSAQATMETLAEFICRWCETE
ncbi:MAG: N-formyl-4-amino-5-aminomethyl-2-methylpyrimidine deformylase [Acidobacteria bacterium]|nr:N-formyl-4-amino-5-aminomethyl-2-methylpyrimidine deformylase [Acidobacteriota bacterium]